MMSIRRISILVLLSLAACQSRNESARKELELVAVWTQTARLGAEAWNQGKVPSHYAEQMVHATADQMRKSERRLRSLGRPAEGDRTAALAAAAAEMERAIQSGDRERSEEALRRLTSAGAPFEAARQDTQ
jgi:hypothetical protein